MTRFYSIFLFHYYINILLAPHLPTFFSASWVASQKGRVRLLVSTGWIGLYIAFLLFWLAALCFLLYLKNITQVHFLMSF